MFGFPKLNTLLVLGAAIGGLLIASTGTATFYEKLIVPAREAKAAETATEIANYACLVTTQAAARTAIKVAEARNAKAVDDALNAYRSSILETQLQEFARREALEKEIANYEQIIGVEGGSCPLDKRGIGFLLGNAE